MAIFVSVCASALLNAPGAEAPRPIIESEVYEINQSGLRHPDPVAFSIRYPKGWTKSETTTGSDNLGDLASPIDHEIVCTFTSPLDPIDRSAPRSGAAAIRTVTNYASITIFRSYAASAREAAQTRLRELGDEVQSLAPVKTGTGDTGYSLIVSDDLPQGHRVTTELFFHAGSKGRIRISICVMGTFLGMREKLQSLLLKSLQFPRATESPQRSRDDI